MEDEFIERYLPCKQCRRLKQSTTIRNTTVSELAISQDIARCLHEYKYNLIYNVVKVLGVQTALDLFFQTAKIQRNGGRMVEEEKRKKEPGGVFLMLVKERATEEEKKIIFKHEKVLHARRKARKKKAKHDKEEKKEKDQNYEKMEVEQSTVGVSVDGANNDQQLTTDELTEQFELMNESDVDFGIEFL